MAASNPQNRADAVGLPLLVYDGDCGFCMRSLAWLRRRLRWWPATSAWQRCDLDAVGLTQPQCQAAMQLVVEDGEVHAGASALTVILRRQPARSWRAVGAALDSRVLRGAVALCYRWTARNRHRLPGSTAGCRLD